MIRMKSCHVLWTNDGIFEEIFEDAILKFCIQTEYTLLS